jgi:hypothetical protein
MVDHEKDSVAGSLHVETFGSKYEAVSSKIEQGDIRTHLETPILQDKKLKQLLRYTYPYRSNRTTYTCIPSSKPGIQSRNIYYSSELYSLWPFH